VPHPRLTRSARGLCNPVRLGCARKKGLQRRNKQKRKLKVGKLRRKWRHRLRPHFGNAGRQKIGGSSQPSTPDVSRTDGRVRALVNVSSARRDADGLSAAALSLVIRRRSAAASGRISRARRAHQRGCPRCCRRGVRRRRHGGGHVARATRGGRRWMEWCASPPRQRITVAVTEGDGGGEGRR
jgi:hypothetical protein